jgi:hypothetical protein
VKGVAPKTQVAYFNGRPMSPVEKKDQEQLLATIVNREFNMHKLLRPPIRQGQSSYFNSGLSLNKIQNEINAKLNIFN